MINPNKLPILVSVNVVWRILPFFTPRVLMNVSNNITAIDNNCAGEIRRKPRSIATRSSLHSGMRYAVNLANATPTAAIVAVCIMAKKLQPYRKAGGLNNASVPAFALWIQCIVAAAWSLSGKYGDLLDMISFVVVGFYMLTIAGIFRLRKTRPAIERPYKAFGYPVLPLLYILMGMSFCILLIIYKPKFTWPGLIITLVGVPVYYVMNRKNNTGKNT